MNRYVLFFMLVGLQANIALSNPVRDFFNVAWKYLKPTTAHAFGGGNVQSHTVEVPPQIEQGQPFIAHPENTVFVFDLHGVVFKKNLIGMARTASKISLSSNFILLLANPFFWYRFCTLALTHGSTEEILYKLADAYPSFKNYIPISIDIINEQLPIPGTIALLQKLKQQGFRLFIFSNIGSRTFEKLAQKFPTIFAYFDGYQVRDPKDNWLQKPNLDAYKKFITSFKLESYNIVFIDDKKSNIRASQDIGMYGILFTNAQDLLKQIRILRALP